VFGSRPSGHEGAPDLVASHPAVASRLWASGRGGRHQDCGQVDVDGLVRPAPAALSSTLTHERSATMRMTDFRTGWAVVGNDGQRLGTLKEIGHDYLLTSRPFAADLYVPVTSIANVEHETVHLNLTRHDAELMGWEQAPLHDEGEPDQEGDLHRHI
jgi:hypothetical protein